MGPNRTQLQKVTEIIQNGHSGLICIPENPSEDAVASATALYLGLMQLGKNVSIACASSVNSNLIASDKIQSEVATSGDSLVISFPYQDGSIDKVDYYIQNERFNIVVTPRPGTEKLNQKDVKYSFTGGTVDFIVTIDTTNLRTLGALYSENQEQFKGKKIVNIDRHLTNSFFGSANYVNRTVSSTAELILGILQTLNVQVDKDIATNLYAGITSATNNYSANTVNAGTFEASAYLLKAGAAKQKQPQQQANGQQRPQQMPPQAPQMTQTRQQNTPMPMPQQQAQQPRFERQQNSRPMQQVERDRMAVAGMEGQTNDEDDEEWLKPKIFKPSGPGTSEMG